MKSYLMESLHVDLHVVHSQYDGWWYFFGIIYLCVVGLMQDFGVLR